MLTISIFPLNCPKCGIFSFSVCTSERKISDELKFRGAIVSSLPSCHDAMQCSLLKTQGRTLCGFMKPWEAGVAAAMRVDDVLIFTPQHQQQQQQRQQ